LTRQIDGVRVRNSAERTSRWPCGPVTQVGALPATSAGVVNTGRVVDAVDTTAEVVRPIRTRTPAGMAVPVVVTLVPRPRPPGWG
jgi:hypothetical protein